jgi:perosamine synthetase
LDTGWVSSVGPFVTRLERWAAGHFSAEGAVAVASGTAALHVALLLAGVQPDDEVVLPTLTFIAPANAVRYVGAWPVFIDAEPDYWQMDSAEFERFLSHGCRREADRLVNITTGRRVRAVVPVNVVGHPCDMDAIVTLAHDAGLVVIEDATESLGSQYKGRPAGLLGDIGCLSFNGNKIVTAGGGGLIVTRERALADRARYLTTQAKDDPLEYVHGEIGYNYRLTNVSAAIAVAQVQRLDEFVATRRRIAERYASAFAAVSGIGFMSEAPWAESNCWLSSIVVDEEAYGRDSRSLLHELAAAGIHARPLWQPMHRSPAHGASSEPREWVADRLNREVLSLPSSASLVDEDQDRVVEIIASGARV